MLLRKLLLLLIILTMTLPTQINGVGQDDLQLNSEAAILIDAQSGDILYNKLGDQTMYPASITKIVTAIVAIEEGNLDDIVTVSENARSVIGTRVYLEKDEQVKMEKLVKGLLINSGNDAGVAIAEHIDGSVDAFAERMNRFVKEEIGVQSTHFENPHGLYDPNHTTTAKDMAKITQYAMQNETFRDIAAIKQMKWEGESWDTTIYNHHRLVRQREDVTGVKNGFVSQSGFTLVTSATQDNLHLIAVTLKATTADAAYNDTEALLDYGFENFQTYTVEADYETHQVGNSEYVLKDDYVFTAEKDLDWNSNVNEFGKLIITDQEGKTVDTHELTEVVQAASTDKSPLNKQKPETKTNQFSVWGTLIGIGVLLITLFVIKKVRKRRKRFFY